MADHDRRRQAMRRQRSLAREAFHANQEMGSQINYFGSDFVEVKGGDLDDILHDLLHGYLPLTARAA
ncbi:hypothetical protein SESBI_22903 [Sesbania bispinosa]|nr:hypothetical protein SESBI_22903 [Sesbania bispinosa]